MSPGYGFRTIADVMADLPVVEIDWYGVDGIFLDGVIGNSGGPSRLRGAIRQNKALATSLGIDLHVVGNPGIPFTQVEAYLAATDTLNIFEGPLTNSNPHKPALSFIPIAVLTRDCLSGSRM